LPLPGVVDYDCAFGVGGRASRVLRHGDNARSHALRDLADKSERARIGARNPFELIRRELAYRAEEPVQARTGRETTHELLYGRAVFGSCGAQRDRASISQSENSRSSSVATSQVGLR